MNNKENTLPVLRTERHDENSFNNSQESLKVSIKENVASQQTRSKTNYVKIDVNENTKGKDNKGKNALDKNAKTQTTTKKNFAEMNKSTSPTASPILTKSAKKSSFIIQTEQLRSEGVLVESAATSRHKEVTLHHKLTKQLQVPVTTIETINAKELIQKFNQLKQQKEMKQKKLQEIREKKQTADSNTKIIKTRIDNLKKEIKEQEEVQEELLSILKPIEESASKAKSLKEKQDLAEELLNMLSVLHYQIQELEEQKA